LTISIGLRAFIEAPSPQITKTNHQYKIPMSFQKQSSSAGKTQGNALEQLRAVSLIYLAANLDDPIYSSSDREIVCHFRGAWVDKGHVYAPTSRRARFASLH
jgi:hypothetical protein